MMLSGLSQLGRGLCAGLPELGVDVTLQGGHKAPPPAPGPSVGIAALAHDAWTAARPHLPALATMGAGLVVAECARARCLAAYGMGTFVAASTLDGLDHLGAVPSAAAISLFVGSAIWAADLLMPVLGFGLMNYAAREVLNDMQSRHHLALPAPSTGAPRGWARPLGRGLGLVARPPEAPPLPPPAPPRAPPPRPSAGARVMSAIAQAGVVVGRVLAALGALLLAVARGAWLSTPEGPAAADGEAAAPRAGVLAMSLPVFPLGLPRFSLRPAPAGG